MKNYMKSVALLCASSLTSLSLSAEVNINENFDSASVGTISTSGTDINGNTYIGSTSVTTGTSALEDPYPSQIKKVDGNGYISLWNEVNTRGNISWDASGNPASPVANVIVDLGDNANEIVNTFIVDVDITKEAATWWYRIQYSVDNGSTWQSIKEISSGITTSPGNVVTLYEADLNLSGVDKVRISTWRNGGIDPGEMVIDNLKIMSGALPEGQFALDFAGDAKNQRIEVPDSPSLEMGAEWSLALWIKPDVAAISSTEADIVLKGKNEIGYETWNMSLRGGKADFRFGGGTARADKTVTSATTLAANEWVHIAVTYDNDGSDGKNLKIYINGVEDGSSNPTIVAGNNAVPLLIGGDYNRRRFDGTIDELSIWNKTLSATEVNAVATESLTEVGGEVYGTVTNQKISSLLWSDLNAYFPMQEGLGTTTDDQSSNASVGTMIDNPVWVDSTNDWSFILTPAIGLEVTQHGTEFTWIVEEEASVKEYRVVDSATGEIIETMVAGEGSYTTTVPEGVAVKLVVVDNSGFYQTFIPADGNIVKVAYDLQEGWNLIAMPGDNADTTEIESAFWGWNGSAYEIVEAPTTGKAVWVYSAVARQAVVTAEKVETELTLEAGWNMVGPAENIEIPAEAHTVYGWNDTYHNIATEDGVLIQGVGYWIFSL